MQGVARGLRKCWLYRRQTLRHIRRVSHYKNASRSSRLAKVLVLQREHAPPYQAPPRRVPPLCVSIRTSVFQKVL